MSDILRDFKLSKKKSLEQVGKLTQGQTHKKQLEKNFSGEVQSSPDENNQSREGGRT